MAQNYMEAIGAMAEHIAKLERHIEARRIIDIYGPEERVIALTEDGYKSVNPKRLPAAQ